MKPNGIFLLSCLLAYVVIISCNKSQDNIAKQNHFPVARAGDDITINLVSCVSSRLAQLNGSLSYDPDSDDKIISYSWTKLLGPSCSIVDNGSPLAKATYLINGQYAFELLVKDNSGLSSRDTVMVFVTGSPVPQEVNLDVIINSNYSFHNNGMYCYDAGWLEECVYADITDFTSQFNLSLGQCIFKTYELADTAISGPDHDTQMSFTVTVAPSLNVSGSSSINFKKIIQQGGGPFAGTWKLEQGTASSCDQNIFTSLVPLILTGDLDTTAHIISLKIQGKVYF